VTAATLAHHAHEEVTETVVEPLDVSEHAHPRMVQTPWLMRPCSARGRSRLYGQGASFPYGWSAVGEPLNRRIGHVEHGQATEALLLFVEDMGCLPHLSIA
jgi:hypothetical protein